MRALVIDKQDWARRQLIELPTGFLFHLGNAWEEDTANGTVIHLDYVRSADARGLLVDAREVMRGRLAGTPGPRLTAMHLNLRNGRATQSDLGIEAEFLASISASSVGGIARSFMRRARWAGFPCGAPLRAPKLRQGLRSASVRVHGPSWKSISMYPMDKGRAG
jgi:carotenoid cleavage dioxygenase-like enzyme